MSQSFIEKQEQMKAFFASAKDKTERYHKIMELGKKHPKLDERYKKDEHLVEGCQSRAYIAGTWNEESQTVTFYAEADALISSGLIALLVNVYSGESPATILKSEPTYLDTLDINASLSAVRINGLASIYLKMKQVALAFLVKFGAC